MRGWTSNRYDGCRRTGAFAPTASASTPHPPSGSGDDQRDRDRHAAECLPLAVRSGGEPDVCDREARDESVGVVGFRPAIQGRCSRPAICPRAAGGPNRHNKGKGTQHQKCPANSSRHRLTVP